MQNSEKSKTVWVTGSGRGIGRAVALEFAKKGYRVVINAAHNLEELGHVRQDIEEMGAECLEIPGDVGNAAFVEEAFDIIHQSFGKLDILVNNAGISYIGLLQDMTPDDWDKMINTNLTSVYNTCRLAIKDMLSAKEGRIINVSSVWGISGASCEVAYSAAKGGVNSFTKALAKELAPSNIAVNAVACGAIDTSMNGWLSPDDKKALEDEIPAGRMGTVREVAELIVQLAESPAYLTGQIIAMDGGWQ